MEQAVADYNADYDLQFNEKMVDLSPTVFVQPTYETYTHAHLSMIA